MLRRGGGEGYRWVGNNDESTSTSFASEFGLFLSGYWTAGSSLTLGIAGGKSLVEARDYWPFDTDDRRIQLFEFPSALGSHHAPPSAHSSY